MTDYHNLTAAYILWSIAGGLFLVGLGWVLWGWLHRKEPHSVHQAAKTYQEASDAGRDIYQAGRDIRIGQLQVGQDPRRLAPEQKQLLIDNLKRYTDTPFFISLIGSSDVEARNLARDIKDALEASGWQYQSNVLTQINMAPDEGVLVRWRDEDGHAEAAAKLLGLLNEMELRAKRVPHKSQPRIDIYVGSNP